MSVLLKIEQALPSLSPIERKIGKAFLENSAEFVGKSIGEAAERIGTNKPAITRFCKKIDYDGYRDLAMNLAFEQGGMSVLERKNEYSDVNIGDSAEAVIESVCKRNVAAISDSCALLEPEKVDFAAKKLFSARKIDFYAIGGSWIAASDAENKFLRIGKAVSAYVDPSRQLTSAANLMKEDVAVAISWSGESDEVVLAAEIAKKSGAFVISVTGKKGSRLEKIADLNFTLTSRESDIRIGSMGSRVAQCTLVDVLFTLVVSNNFSEVKGALNATRVVVSGKNGGEK